MKIELFEGDCLSVLSNLPDCSVDSVVTDPPYGLSFMGKKWDYDVPDVEIWSECLRVLKPGGHLLAFAGTRTQHRMACRIEDAGFEIRDMIAWVYGSGFPKSLNVSKAIDKAAGAEREIVGQRTDGVGNTTASIHKQEGFAASRETVFPITAPAPPAAQQWSGWGTALKPALEPITVARKPFKGTVAANVQQHGTGAINVDGCRVGTTVETWPKSRSYTPWQMQPGHAGATQVTGETPAGRWPANLIHDGSDEVVELFPETGVSRGGNSLQINVGSERYNWNKGSEKAISNGVDPGYGDSGSAARFFYCAKANKKDRGEGNNHPTVKPTQLMRYLCRLVTPPGGVVLDPFMGSGSTGKAAVLENFSFIGVEMDPDYFALSRKRIAEVEPPDPFTGDTKA